MIRPLRTRHRITIIALAVILPVLFVASLLARKPPAAMDTTPDVLRAELDGFEILLFEGADLWNSLAINTRIRADREPATRLAVELKPQETIDAPDILVYWYPSGRAGDAFPDEAYLLGSLSGTSNRQFALPDTALDTDGRLLLYSAGHDGVISTATLPSLPGRPNPE